jgi:sulfite reductase (NADPH) hemoprotein beta-component
MDLLAAVEHARASRPAATASATSPPTSFAGVAPDEVVDPRPYCETDPPVVARLHPEFAFLPRKFKIAVRGAVEDRAATAWHDIGLHVLQERRRARWASGCWWVAAWAAPR